MLRLLRFRLTSLLWLVLSCGLACGWLKDRNDKQRHVADLEQRLRDAETLTEMRRMAVKLDAPPRRGLQTKMDAVRFHRLKLWTHFKIDSFLTQMRVRESPWRRDVAGLSCEALTPWLGHADAEARLAAVDELLKHGAEAAPQLVKALEDEDEEVAGLALHGLKCLGPHAREALPKIRVFAKRHRSPLGIYAASILREIDPQSDIDLLILFFAGSDDPDTQEFALTLHEQVGSPHAAPAILESLGGREQLSAAGIMALGQLGSPEEAVPLLIRAFRDAGDDDTRQIAAFALGRIEARSITNAGGGTSP